MKKILVLFLCFCALSCNDKDEDIHQLNSPWADEYQWLEKIMIKAEKGGFKDANGKPATVQIYALELENEHYFFLNYGRSGGLMYEETRDNKGNIIEKLDPELPPGPYERIYPVY